MADTYNRKRIFGVETEFGLSSRLTYDRLPSIGGFINNGGRVYNDGGHAEYASPETSNPRDAVLFDKAGELVVSRLLPKWTLYKNNRDSRGRTFGTHENYFINVGDYLDTEKLSQLIPFLITRQIYAGSGHYKSNDTFCISQRSEFIKEAISGDTTDYRGIVCSRIEEDTDMEDWVRLHLILGDANMCEVADYMKLGITGLLWDLFEDDKVPSFDFGVDTAVNNLREISYNTSGWKVRCIPGIPKATDVQRRYLEAVVRNYSGRDTVTDDIINRWIDVLDILDNDPMELFGQVDWVTKKTLLDQYKSRNASYEKGLQNINLQYHDIDRNKGVFYALQNRGLIDRILSDDEIAHAAENPPRDTRANYRAALVRLNREYGVMANRFHWQFFCVDRMLTPDNEFNENMRRRDIALNDPFDSQDADAEKIMKIVGDIRA
jgi:hypothetical protein